jgi:hypothetical protein
VVSAAACSSTNHPTPPRPHGDGPAKVQPVDVPITSPRDSAAPTVMVSIGRDRPIRVLLDSGSVGLRVLASAVPHRAHSGIDVSYYHTRITLEDGSVLPGVVARSTIHIGRLATTGPVIFELVTDAHCVAAKPHCRKISDIGAGIVGILGIGMEGNQLGYPTNPLVSLPTAYSQTWSIHEHATGSSTQGELELGAVEPRSPEATIKLNPSDYSEGALLAWTDDPVMCWRIASASQCGRTYLDTGSRPVYVTGYPADHPRSGFLPPGDKVELYSRRGNQTIWAFDAAPRCCSARTVILQREHPPTFTTGIALFYAHTVTFDNRRGLIDID